MTRRGEAGFTLLELLVALVVFGFVLAGIAGGVQFGLRAGGMQAQRIASTADLGGADRILRRLVAEMDPGTVTEAPEVAGHAATLSFVTDLGRAAAALSGDGEADVALGVDESHRLVLRWTPYRHGINLGPAPGVSTSVLLEGVDRVQFAYWGHGEGAPGNGSPCGQRRGYPRWCGFGCHSCPAAVSAGQTSSRRPNGGLGKAKKDRALSRITSL